jgi:hypothetical protein
MNMNKKIAYFLAFCVVSMVLMVMIPSVSADVGTIITTDSSGAPDHWFRQGDYIYYQIAMPSGYEGEYVKITIADEDGTQVHTNFEYLDSFAEYKSWNPIGNQSYDSYYVSGFEDVGPNWNISVLKASTLELLKWYIFEVYVPTQWTATVTLYEDGTYTIPTTSFPVDSRVYYTVHIEDEHNAPLSSTYVDLYVEHNTDKYHIDSWVWINSEGDGDDWFDLDDWWSSGDQPGDYILEIQYPDGTSIPITKDFTVYEPVYTATIKTWLEGYAVETSIYPMNGRVYWTAHIEDQYGRNLSQSTSVYLQIEHDESIWRPSGSHYVDDHGNISDNFWLWSSSWNDEEQIGLYNFRLSDSRYGDPFLGSTNFEVIGIKISPEKTKYAQGEEITITITTEIYQSNINITILDEDRSIVDGWYDQSMANKIWTTIYPLADTLPDGLYYLQVNESDTGRLLGEIQFTVKKYTLQIWPDAGAYLPGEIMTFYYTITSNKDGSGVSGTIIEYIFEYYDIQDGEWKTLPSQEFTAGAYGSREIAIPESASKSWDASLHIWANDTSDHSSYNHQNVEIGWISAYLSLGYNEYLAGDFVVATISAYIDGSYPLKNGNVYLNVSKDGVEITGYTVSNLETDSQGRLTYIFALQSNAEIGMYVMSINVSKENEWDRDKEDFEIVEKRELSLELGFDNKYYSDSDDPLYYSGETVTVTYTALRGEEIVENVNCEYWVRVAYGDSYISAGTSSTGEFSFEIPGDFEGSLTLYVQVTDSESNKASQTEWIDVDGPNLLLKTNTNEYLPGDTIKVDYSVVGIDILDANYYYEIKDNHGNVIKREGLTSPTGKFEFTVPEANVPDSYYIRGYITDTNGDTIAQRSVRVTRLRGYIITFSLDKKTYRPGETATLHYKVTSVDDSEIPQDFTLTYGYYGGEQRTTQTSKAEGDLKVKIPEDASDGVGYFYMSSSDLPYGDRSSTNTQQEANIRESPNPLAETIGDIPFLSLILLILVIIALIFGIGGWRRGKKALEEAKLPPWKKEGPLPEPEKFKEPEPSLEEPTPPSPEEIPPSPEEAPPSPEEAGTEPPKDLPPP